MATNVNVSVTKKQDFNTSPSKLLSPTSATTMDMLKNMLLTSDHESVDDEFEEVAIGNMQQSNKLIMSEQHSSPFPSLDRQLSMRMKKKAGRTAIKNFFNAKAKDQPMKTFLSPKSIQSPPLNTPKAYPDHIGGFKDAQNPKAHFKRVEPFPSSDLMKKPQTSPEPIQNLNTGQPALYSLPKTTSSKTNLQPVFPVNAESPKNPVFENLKQKNSLSDFNDTDHTRLLENSPRGRNKVKTKRKRKRVMSEPPTFRARKLSQSKKPPKDVGPIYPLAPEINRLLTKRSVTFKSDQLMPKLKLGADNDASMEEIEKNGLKSLLGSKVPLTYFLHSLVSDMNSENLFFYLDVHEFEIHPFKCLNDQYEVAKQIMEMYFSPNSYFELNLDQKTIKETMSEFQRIFQKVGRNPNLPKTNENCFKEAKKAVIKLMEECFRKFKLSPNYQLLKREMSTGALYNAERKKHAIQHLISHLKPDLAQTHPMNRMMRPQLHRFCITFLNADFNDKTFKVDFLVNRK